MSSPRCTEHTDCRAGTEALQPAEAVFDASTGFVEGPSEEGGSVLFVGFVRDDGRDATASGSLAIGLAGIAFVADDGTRPDVGTDVEQRLERGRLREGAESYAKPRTRFP